MSGSVDRNATREGDAAQAIFSARFMRTLNERFKREVVLSAGDNEVDESDFRKSTLINPKLPKGTLEFEAAESGQLIVRFRLAGFCLTEPDSDSVSSDSIDDDDDETLEPYLVDRKVLDALKFAVAFAAFDFTRYGAPIGMLASSIASKGKRSPNFVP